MSLIRLAAGWLLVSLVAACAVAPADPGEGVRKALAPNGKLRVGLTSVPVHAIRDPYSGNLRGVSHDLGRERAARLVPADTRIASVGDTDRPGVRVALVAGSSSAIALAKDLKQASLVRGRDLSELIELVFFGEADVIAAQKTNLYNIAPRIPGSRVLDGRSGSEEQALAIPKGRDPLALAYVQEFVRDAKNRGLIQQAIDRAGVRGVVVAP